MEIKIQYKDGNTFTVTIDEKNVQNVTACLLDELMPIWRKDDD